KHESNSAAPDQNAIGAISHSGAPPSASGQPTTRSAITPSAARRSHPLRRRCGEGPGIDERIVPCLAERSDLRHVPPSSMNRARLLTVLALAALPLFGCKSNCRVLAEKLCSCSISSTARESCL